MTDNVVDLKQYSEQLNKAIDYAPGDVAKTGLFGPGSYTWKFGKEWVIFMGSLRTLLMQEAHPIVNKALNDHTKVEKDPVGRWKRSLGAVNDLCFGDLITARKASAMMFNVHSHIKGTMDDGTPYHANQEGALLWVAACMFDTVIYMTTMGFGHIPSIKKAVYYNEFRRYCYTFGISDETIPPTYNDFVDYYNGMVMSGYLKVDEKTRQRYEFFRDKFLTGSFKELKLPAQAYLAFTAGIMPKNIREQYGMPFGMKERVIYQSYAFMIANFYRKLPESLRTNIYYKQQVQGLYV